LRDLLRYYWLFYTILNYRLLSTFIYRCWSLNRLVNMSTPFWIWLLCKLIIIRLSYVCFGSIWLSKFDYCWFVDEGKAFIIFIWFIWGLIFLSCLSLLLPLMPESLLLYVVFFSQNSGYHNLSRFIVRVTDAIIWKVGIALWYCLGFTKIDNLVIKWLLIYVSLLRFLTCLYRNSTGRFRMDIWVIFKILYLSLNFLACILFAIFFRFFFHLLPRITLINILHICS